MISHNSNVLYVHEKYKISDLNFPR